jgi:hypothetical protein
MILYQTTGKANSACGYESGPVSSALPPLDYCGIICKPDKDLNVALQEMYRVARAPNESNRIELTLIRIRTN